MVIYTLSSTDPKHFNRIQVKLPIEYASKFVNVCVTSLTCNCNIEVMNEEDYIEFEINDEIKRVFMTSNSKLTTASLPYILQDLFDENDVKITAEITDVDTLRFICEHPFRITDMSYNMKLITGYYYLKIEGYPIESVEYIAEYSATEKTEQPLTDIVINEMNIKVNSYKPFDITTTPPDAYGYNISYTSENDEIVIVNNGVVYGISAGEVKVNIEVRNPGTLLTSAADFTKSVLIRVVEGVAKTEIEEIVLKDSITLYEGEVLTLYPETKPINADGYVDSWVSNEPSIASVSDGVVIGNKIGKTKITYTINNNLENETQTITKEITVNVISSVIQKVMNKTTCEAVGYTLSTPILYLLSSIGNGVFFNEICDEEKMNSGTIAMVLNNSYSSSFPIVAQQADIITRAPLNMTSNFWIWLVDANMREIKLLNPIYLTVSVVIDESEVIYNQQQQIQQ